MKRCFIFAAGTFFGLRERPISDDLMKLQLDFAYEKYQTGQIEGMMLCSNCNADIGLTATQITKDWIAQL